MYEGSCLCRGIAYAVDAELGEFVYCHCTSCRKASGTVHSANASVPRAKFALKQGAELLREYESSPGKTRTFCSRCGSPVYAFQHANPDVLRVRLGSLDTPFTKQSTMHIWVSEKAPWAPIADELPQFPEWPVRSK